MKSIILAIPAKTHGNKFKTNSKKPTATKTNSISKNIHATLTRALGTGVAYAKPGGGTYTNI
jgi:hypothetical protein